MRSINILKIISHPSKGCNRKRLLQLYRSLIRSRLDYGAPIYNLTSKSVLSLIDTIQTSSLRLALGAFRTSPRLSLCAEAAEPPLFYRRLVLTSNLLSSVAQYPQLPIYNSIFLPAPSPYPVSHKHISQHLNPLLASPSTLSLFYPYTTTSPMVSHRLTSRWCSPTVLPIRKA